MGMSAAERQRARRERLKAGEAHQINIVLPAGAFATLKGLCEASGRNYSDQIATLLMNNRDPLVHTTTKEAKSRAKAERERVRLEKAAHDERIEELRLKTALAEAGRLLPDAKPTLKGEDGVYRVPLNPTEPVGKEYKIDSAKI